MRSELAYGIHSVNPKETTINDEESERKFLHDLASPLATAIFLVDMAQEDLATNPAEIAESMKKIAASLEKTKVLLHARRTYLILQSEREKK